MNLSEVDPILKLKILGGPVLLRTMLFIAVTAGVWGMGVRQLAFPWWYHNDEPSKVQQLQSGERNLRHPPLMLTVTDAFAAVAGIKKDAQAIVELGRLFSLFYLALAIAWMVDWAFVMVHPAAAFFLGLTLPFIPALFESGHYFKEDAIFLLGVALSFRALAYWMQKEGRWPALSLGLSLAVLAGTKYAGWLVVLLILVPLLVTREKSPKRKEFLLLCFLGALAVVYWPAFTRPEVWSHFLKDEVFLLFSGDYGSGLAVPHAVYWSRLCGSLSLPLLIAGFAAYIVALFRRGLPGFGVIPLTCLIMMAGLSWTSKYSDRYLLPVILLGVTVVVCGPVLWVLSYLKNGSRSRLGIMVLLLAGMLPAFLLLRQNMPDFRKRFADFQTDSRMELVQWMKAHLEPQKVILAEDTLAKVDAPEYYDRMWRSYFVADLGSLEELKSHGITHLIVSYDVYHRFVDGSVVTGPADGDLFSRRSRFYQQILRDGKILWSDEGRDPKALHPGLKLIELR